MNTEKTKDPSILIEFNDYTVFYYSHSRPAHEAAYINCFKTCGVKKAIHVGTMVFIYSGMPMPANKLENRPDAPNYFVVYYDLSRFNDVVNLLRYAVKDNCKDQAQSMIMSVNPTDNIWALANNLHPAVGAQYMV